MHAVPAPSPTLKRRRIIGQDLVEYTIFLDELSAMVNLDFQTSIEILIIVLNFIWARKPPTMVSTMSTSSDSADCGETRCECGQLIAKVRGQGLELKCKRCKRIVVIPFSSIEGWGTVAS